MTDTIDVRVMITLPNGSEQVFGYRWAEHFVEGVVFAPLPVDREIDPMAMYEAQAQRDRRGRIADVIAQQLADAILEAAGNEDTVRGWKKRR